MRMNKVLFASAIAAAIAIGAYGSSANSIEGTVGGASLSVADAVPFYDGWEPTYC